MRGLDGVQNILRTRHGGIKCLVGWFYWFAKDSYIFFRILIEGLWVEWQCCKMLRNGNGCECEMRTNFTLPEAEQWRSHDFPLGPIRLLSIKSMMYPHPINIRPLFHINTASWISRFNAMLRLTQQNIDDALTLETSCPFESLIQTESDNPDFFYKNQVTLIHRGAKLIANPSLSMLVSCIHFSASIEDS